MTAHTIAECEALLMAALDRARAADEAGDDVAYELEHQTLSDLLEERIHLPQQRKRR